MSVQSVSRIEGYDDDNERCQPDGLFDAPFLCQLSYVSTFETLE